LIHVTAQQNIEFFHSPPAAPAQSAFIGRHQ
jgi:hypothetical protein